ncbi:MAG: iron-sulfur cluster assembly protein [Thermoplasmata archaeon]|nr:iron-sulfur cluster assembly protein [Thermoplasmata archaeon]
MVEERDVRAAMESAAKHMGASLVDLGLIDSIVVDGVSVRIRVVPHCDCPFLPSVLEDMYEAVIGVPGIDEVDIEVIWSVQWRPSRLSEEGRRCLGLPSDPR